MQFWKAYIDYQFSSGDNSNGLRPLESPPGCFSVKSTWLEDFTFSQKSELPNKEVVLKETALGNHHCVASLKDPDQSNMSHAILELAKKAF